MVELPRCKICQNPLRMKIQSDIDMGKSYEYITTVYSISTAVIVKHKKENHKQALLLYEEERKMIRERADDNVDLLFEYIGMWREQLKQNGRVIKDNDALRAIEFVEKLLGHVKENHEIKFSEDLGKAIDKYLNEESE